MPKTYEEYYKGYEDDKGHRVKGYEELVELLRKFIPGEVIASEEEKKAFVQIFGALLRVLNILQAFDQFAGHELLSERDMQDYLGMYNDIYQELKPSGHDKEKIKDDLVFEMELVKQVEINIDYILALVRKYRGQNGKDRELTLRDIDRAIKSSPQMRDKKALIDAFVRSVTPGSDVDDDWNTFVRQKMQEEINDIISTEHLKDAPARKFIRDSFDNGYVQTEGTGIADIMPPLNPFKQHAGRAEKKAVILDKIKALFNRFYGLIGPASPYEADKAVKRYTLPEEDGELLMAAEPGPAGT